ncbi:hypothetical protein G6F43_013544 [Rhizopus delemar]|nr:hypothetical protein G6F43_013544 [Rhizopus delemar]
MTLIQNFIICTQQKILSGGELNPGLPRDRRGYLPLYYRRGPLVGSSASSPSPSPINCLLYADDVALVGSAREVRHMLDLAQIHSLTLGYKWSPSKCAVLNSPLPTSRRFARMSLYDEDLPSVDEFVYLGIPFCSKGISVSAMVKHRASSTLFAMSQLNAMGLNP